jgi:hypothetical protein
MKQLSSSFCFYLVSTLTSEKFEPVKYTASGDEDVAKIFVDKLTEYSNMICNKYEKYPKGKIFTNDAVNINIVTQQYVTSANILS